MQTATTTLAGGAGLGLLLRMRLVVLRNRIGQLVNQSPMRLLLALLFVAGIWGVLYAVFDHGLVFMRRFEQSAIALPYIFHLFFAAMTVLLAFSTAVLVYGSLFGRAEPPFLMAAPNSPRNIVTLMYVEALFFSSWSLLLLGVPLMLAVGQVLGLPWHFYVVFVLAFLGFVPIPGAIGLLVALGVALWLPRMARRTLLCAGGAILAAVIIWWVRLWGLTPGDIETSLHDLMAEFAYIKAALLPSTWVSRAIQQTVEDAPGVAGFYLAVTWTTALFFSWAAVNIAGRKLAVAFGRAHAAPIRTRAGSGWISCRVTRIGFWYLPTKMRVLILKDLRNFLRDPMQWSQLAILFGLMGLYLIYLPRARPGGFNIAWRAMICFLNYGTITLILSTFTSRFVYPMISLEGRQMWLVGLWPMSRTRVMWAKFLYAYSVTAAAALVVTALSVRSLGLPMGLGLIQVFGTLATCGGLCGLAVGLGARLPNYKESNPGRIASGLGGTINLIASVSLVTVNVMLFGVISYRQAGTGSLQNIDAIGIDLSLLIVLIGLGTGAAAMRIGCRSFQRQEF